MKRHLLLFALLVSVIVLFTSCAPPQASNSPVVRPVIFPANPPPVGPLPGVDPMDPDQSPATETWTILELLEDINLKTTGGDVTIGTADDIQKYEIEIKKMITEAEQNEQHNYDEHEWERFGYSERHPHYVEYKCACGATLQTGETASFGMTIVGPSVTHPHNMVESCSICGEHFENPNLPTTLTWILQGYTKDHPHYMITKCSQCSVTEINTAVTAIDNGACSYVAESATAEHPHNMIITCTYEGCDYEQIDPTHTAEWAIEIDDENNYSVTHPHYLFGVCNYEGCDHVEQTNQTVDWTWEDGVCSICGQHKKMLYTQTPTGKAITGVQEDFADSHYDIPSTIGNEPVTEIWSRAFAGLPILQSVVIPEGVRLIGDGAFTDCPELSAVIIPPSVCIIENRAFASCPSLKEVEINTLVAPVITAEIFAGCHPDMVIYVPEGAEGFQIGPWEELPVVWR